MEALKERGLSSMGRHYISIDYNGLVATYDRFVTELEHRIHNQGLETDIDPDELTPRDYKEYPRKTGRALHILKSYDKFVDEHQYVLDSLREHISSQQFARIQFFHTLFKNMRRVSTIYN